MCFKLFISDPTRRGPERKDAGQTAATAAVNVWNRIIFFPWRVGGGNFASATGETYNAIKRTDLRKF